MDVSHWTLSVTDLERSSRFYRDVMGWAPVASPGGDAVRFVRDGQRVELVALPAPVTERRARPEVHHLGLSHITVATGPALETMARLRECGADVRDATLGSFVHDGDRTQFLFEDPDGNVIETFAAGEDWNPFGIGESDTDRGSRAGILHLSHWSLCVADPDVSLPFYRDVLGWAEIMRLDWEGPGPSRVMGVGPARLTTWLLGSGGQRIEVIHFAEPPSPPPPDRRAPGLSHISVLVDDAASTARALGVSAIRAAVGDGTVTFEDPDGNVIVGLEPGNALRWPPTATR